MNTKAHLGQAPQSARKSTGAEEVREKIAAMPVPHNVMGERLHALILCSAPHLEPRLWYGMPAYAKGGKTICFFRSDKRYMTLGITLDANLSREEGAPHQLIASAWYFEALDEVTEAKLSTIVSGVAG